ncbi:hypothetical protein EJ05DRAFT_516807 [Pseudovirgaria hyperparasitica]|uniref:Peptidase M43 pregnancy-associated plasma-A domain-containing protein n=1 Tax=Pseudovirgaria hyperparasitica TaxID=470096 RepID=A0A6A6WME8_9PEZI|nr:uncharacterized protein EJ05DRAFT_516807 [Pseudovirgaria hyperparasitica]KAF2763328.1 hypothetical protein EJ05DRAFT_516807 [Pseudovirgaria hyperparasitica]
MFFFSFLLFFLQCVYAAPGRRRSDLSEGCSTEVPESFANILKRSKTVDSVRRDNHALFPRGNGTNETITIDVYFHVLADGAAEEKGNYRDDVYKKQLAQLNNDFNPYGFRFNLKEIDRWLLPYPYLTPNADYSIKRQLRKGGWSTLNIYTVHIGNGTIGTSTMPHDTDKHPVGSVECYLDGVVISNEALPGIDPNGDRSQGKTATHGVGHWLGLEHTYSHGCDGEGDGIDDTPSMRLLSNGGCAVGADTCPGEHGLDPVRNFMSFSEDECLNEFTKGQVERMKWTWETFRKGR